MLAIRDLAWLAGLLEGEGSFMLCKGSPEIGMQTTDRDVADRAAALFGKTITGAGYQPKGGAHYKRVWGVRVHGAKAIGWMFTLYPFMGERRQAKIREVVAGWRASRRAPRAPRGERFPPTCHPERERSAHGLCHPCYMQRWRAARKAG